MEKIVTNSDNIESFFLTGDSLVANHSQLPEALLHKFKSKYIFRKGCGIYYGTEEFRSAYGLHLRHINV